MIVAMVEAMTKHRGVGLAAPQLGVPWRIIVVSRLARAVEGVPAFECDGEVYDDFGVYINPEILERSAETDVATEGCLTLKGLSRDIERPKAIRVRALGIPVHPLSGLAARIVQHEFDHLEGRLITDHRDAAVPDQYRLSRFLGRAGGVG